MRLDQQQGTVRGESLSAVASGGARVAHVVPCVELTHEVEPLSGEVPRGRHLEPRPLAHTGLGRGLVRGLDRRQIRVDPVTVQPGDARTRRTADPPSPKPTSATLAPSRSLASTTFRAGQPLADQMSGVAGRRNRATPVQPMVAEFRPDACAGAESVPEEVMIGLACGADVEGAAEEDRAVVVSDDHGLLHR